LCFFLIFFLLQWAGGLVLWFLFYTSAQMISLAAQKFLADIAKESYALSKKRQGQPQNSAQQQKSHRRNVLLLEDVASAAAKYGIRVSKPEYFADSINAGLVVEPPPPPEKRGPAAAPANPPARKKKKNWQ
jgi:hypothetical protein